MKRVPLFLRLLGVATGIGLVSALASFTIHFFFDEESIDEYAEQIARSLELSTVGTMSDRMLLAAELMQWPLFFTQYHLWLVDEQGRPVAATVPEPVPLRWQDAKLPEKPLAARQHASLRSNGAAISLVRLEKSPGHFLVVSARNEDTLDAYILFYLRTAWPVILVAALLVTATFRSMARKIEALVEKLRQSESARVSLLQELAHDVRTPLTSLRSVVETLMDHPGLVPGQFPQPILEIADREIRYFQRLIEDLFLIAQLEDPHYRVPPERLDLQAVLREELQVVEGVPGAGSVRFELDAPGDLTVLGSRDLLRRLLRNTLENARRFARGTVRIEARSTNGLIELEVRDDGPGISPEAIGTFGQRGTGALLEAGGTHVSLGLGTVIMTRVAIAHGGSVVAENWVGADGVKGGAVIRIRLPVAAVARLSEAA